MFIVLIPTDYHFGKNWRVVPKAINSRVQIATEGGPVNLQRPTSSNPIFARRNRIDNVTTRMLTNFVQRSAALSSLQSRLSN